MQSATVFVPRDPRVCWKLFTDVSLLGAWVPGLRRVQVITKERGMPSEVHFELSSSRTYTLVYSYDVERREVRWTPKLGGRDAVNGFARFESADDGTRLTYGLEHGEGRSSADRAHDNVEEIVSALCSWLVERSDRT